MKLSACLMKPWQWMARALDKLQPICNVLVRILVSYYFFKAGLVKIQSWDSTVMLFEHEYHVPFVAAEMAAMVAAGIELVAPVFLVLGLMGRVAAFVLFIFNGVAVYAYRSFLFSPEGAAGLKDHFYWAMFLFVILVYGVSKLSLDEIMCRKFCEK